MTKRTEIRLDGSSTKRTAVRLATSAVAVTLTTMAASAPAGAAETKGIGTASVSTTILDAKLGNLLGIQLLNDSARSTTDPKVGTTEAFAQVTQLKVTSIIPSLNKTVGYFEAKTPGGNPTATGTLLDLGTILPASIGTGSIEPINLSTVTAPSAASAMSSRVTDLGFLAGLLNVGVVQSTNRTGSGGALADATRDLSVDAITVLRLGALLKALGIDLALLPLSVINGLVASLGLPIAGLPAGTDLATFVSGLSSSITALVDQQAATVGSTVTGTLTGLLGSNVVTELAITANTTTQAALAAVRATLDGLLQTVLDALDDAALVRVNALELATVAKAAGTVSGSLATATGKVGAVQIGNLVSVPGVDLLATTAQINAATGQINTALNGVLGPLGLGNLVSVRLFDKQTGVAQVDGYVKSVASITGLALRVTPPAALTQVVNTLLASGAPVTSLLSVGTAVPVVGAELAPLVAALGSPAGGVLAQGLSVDVARIASAADHVVPAGQISVDTPASQTPTSLPKTGSESLPLLLGAAALGGAAIGGRRVLRRSRTES